MRHSELKSTQPQTCRKLRTDRATREAKEGVGEAELRFAGLAAGGNRHALEQSARASSQLRGQDQTSALSSECADGQRARHHRHDRSMTSADWLPGAGDTLPDKPHTCRKLYTDTSLAAPAAGGRGKAISSRAGKGPMGRVGAV